MTGKQAKYYQAVLRLRQKYQQPSYKRVLEGLNKQMAPIYKSVNVHGKATDVQHLITSHHLEESFKWIYSTVGNHFGQAIYDSLTKGFAPELYKKEDDEDDAEFQESFDDAIEEFIKTVSAEMIKDITETTKQSVKDFIADAIENGTSGSKLVDELRVHFNDYNKVRAMRIARTEICRAGNVASNIAAGLSGGKMQKTWLHGGSGPNSRETHLEMDGESVGMEETFDVDDDYQPMYPQDGTGGADEEANCQCAVYYTPLD